MKYYSIVTLSFLIFLMGCGGDSSSSSVLENNSSESSTSTPTPLFEDNEIEDNVSISITPRPTSSLPTPQPTPTPTPTPHSLTKGYLIDSPIAGVNYRCGVIPNVIEGITTSTGEFSCEVTPIEFSIGSYSLGTLNMFTVDGKVYPQDLLGLSRDNFTDEKLIVLIQLLQSLDDDGDISKVITIPSNMGEKLGKNANEIELESLVNLGDKELISREEALKHLRANMPHQGGEVIVEIDSDADRIPDTTDQCPHTYGTVKGCPRLSVLSNSSLTIYTKEGEQNATLFIPNPIIESGHNPKIKGAGEITLAIGEHTIPITISSDGGQETIVYQEVEVIQNKPATIEIDGFGGGIAKDTSYKTFKDGSFKYDTPLSSSVTVTDILGENFLVEKNMTLPNGVIVSIRSDGFDVTIPVSLKEDITALNDKEKLILTEFDVKSEDGIIEHIVIFVEGVDDSGEMTADVQSSVNENRNLSITPVINDPDKLLDTVDAEVEGDCTITSFDKKTNQINLRSEEVRKDGMCELTITLTNPKGDILQVIEKEIKVKDVPRSTGGSNVGGGGSTGGGSTGGGSTGGGNGGGGRV